jgi:hypothetical protein
MLWDSQSKRVFSAVAILFAVYFPVAFWVRYSDPEELKISGEKVLFRGQFLQGRPAWGYAGHAYLIRNLKQFEGLADSPEDGSRSPLVIYENDRPLGPPHSAHVDIQNIGEGRYSHWRGTGLMFSTSDNSNPNVNGRVYWVVVPSSQQQTCCK